MQELQTLEKDDKEILIENNENLNILEKSRVNELHKAEKENNLDSLEGNEANIEQINYKYKDSEKDKKLKFLDQENKRHDRLKENAEIKVEKWVDNLLAEVNEDMNDIIIKEEKWNKEVGETLKDILKEESSQNQRIKQEGLNDNGFDLLSNSCIKESSECIESSELRKTDLAYLIGALRDGSVYYYKGNRSYYTLFYQKYREWLENSIGKRINRSFKVGFRIDEYKEGHFRLRISNKKFYDLCRNEYDFPMEGESQLTWLIPKKIMNGSLKEKIEFIRGFFDTEGDCSPKTSKGFYLGLSQKNRQALAQLKTLLAEVGINTTEIHLIDKKSNTYRIAISYKEGIKRFIEKIGVEHPLKRNKINEMKQLID